MRLLVLGGTVFLGRAVVDAALDAGHVVTIFSRGQHDDGFRPEAERVRGDRDGGLGALEGRRFDAVVDTSAFVPRVVRASATMLAGSVDHYQLVSSLSAAADASIPDQAEDVPLATVDDPTIEEVTAETYGGLKVLCEQAVQAALPGRSLVVRPGLIVGPHDPTDRFTYWVRRVAEGGDVLAPGRPERPIQVIDVRDLAGFHVLAAERRLTGVANAISTPGAVTMGAFLDACRRVSGSDARLVWASEPFLVEHGIEGWSDLPAWLPESDPEVTGFMSFRNDRAVADGLRLRPIEETVAAVLAWDRARGERPAPGRAAPGLSAERERGLLAAWADAAA